MDAGETLRKQSLSLFAGLERPRDSFGQPKAPKSGVAPAHTESVLPACKLERRAIRDLYAPNNFASPPG